MYTNRGFPFGEGSNKYNKIPVSSPPTASTPPSKNPGFTVPGRDRFF